MGLISAAAALAPLLWLCQAFPGPENLHDFDSVAVLAIVSEAVSILNVR